MKKKNDKSISRTKIYLSQPPKAASKPVQPKEKKQTPKASQHEGLVSRTAIYLSQNKKQDL